MIGLIMSIVGGTSSISSTGVYTVQVTSEAGIALYCVKIQIALVLLTFITVSKVSHITSSDNRLVWAVIVALPLILVRLCYSLLLVFHHSHEFNLVSGSVVLLVCLSVIEEMLVVLIYLFVGWMTDAPPKETQGPITNRPWKGALNAGIGGQDSNSGTGRGRAVAGDMQGYPTADGRQTYPSASAEQQFPSTSARRQRPRGNGRGFRQGPIHGLVGLAMSAAQNNKGDVERG